MIALYSNWWIQQGKEETVYPLLRELANAVLENEPDTLMYTVHTPNYDFPTGTDIVSEPMPRPGAITFVENYADWEAFETHVNGPIFTSFLKNNGHLFVQGEPNPDGSTKPFIQVVFMNRITGFIREDDYLLSKGFSTPD
ncbi:MAG: antibiotic biosynthesis monooxygenase [Bacteroidia bacterium]|nr:antibiotic biosynthesis monooxygenase [Bacteroidia bacterium]